MFQSSLFSESPVAVETMEVQLAKTMKNRGSLSSYEGTHIAQVKYDGTRVLITRKADGFSMMSRSGKNDFQGYYPELVSELMAIPHEYVLDGELVFFSKKTGKPEFLTALATSGTRQNYTVKIILFDILELDGRKLISEPQKVRSGILDALKCTDWDLLDVVVTYQSGFDELLWNTLANGGEGLVVKDMSAPYKCGKRPNSWLKVKKIETHDCFVVGMTRGNGKYENTFGALVLAQMDMTGNPCIVGKCSGMTDEIRLKMYGEIKNGINCGAEMVAMLWGGNTSLHDEMLCCVAPMHVVEVKCMEKLASGLMRHPVFIRVRDDKEWAECKI